MTIESVEIIGDLMVCQGEEILVRDSRSDGLVDGEMVRCQKKRRREEGLQEEECISPFYSLKSAVLHLQTSYSVADEFTL